MDMPKVKACSVTECSYNVDKQCHALAINVGGVDHPACDTYTKMSNKGGDPGSTSAVGACRTTACKFNKSLECNAPGITVGHHENHADCETFTQM